MARAAKIHRSIEVLIQLGIGEPLSFCFPLGDMGTFNFYLAPMIE